MLIASKRLTEFPSHLVIVLLHADRLQLAKRRWRATADDGTEFGFDLAEPLNHGDTFHLAATARYVIEQQPEPVLEMPLPSLPGRAAQIGWWIGNLHFALELSPNYLRVIDDPAVRQLCDRLQLPYQAVERIFRPLAGGHSH